MAVVSHARRSEEVGGYIHIYILFIFRIIIRFSCILMHMLCFMNPCCAAHVLVLTMAVLVCIFVCLFFSGCLLCHAFFMLSLAFAVFHEFILCRTLACTHFGCGGLFIHVYINGLCASAFVVSPCYIHMLCSLSGPEWNTFVAFVQIILMALR